MDRMGQQKLLRLMIGLAADATPERPLP